MFSIMNVRRSAKYFLTRWTWTQTDPHMPVNMDFWQAIAEWLVPKFSSLFKFWAGTITTAGDIIWDGTNWYDGFLATAQQLTVSSASALDTNWGTGAWNILIFWLDDDLKEQSEIVVLDWTNPVLTQKTYKRLNRGIIIEWWSLAKDPITGANQGLITVAWNVGGEEMIIIQPNKGQTLMCIYTVPAGKTLYVTWVWASLWSGKEARISFKFRNCETEDCVFSTKYDIQLFENSVTQTLETPLQVPEKTDILVIWTASVGSVEISASFGWRLVDNI